MFSRSAASENQHINIYNHDDEGSSRDEAGGGVVAGRKEWVAAGDDGRGHNRLNLLAELEGVAMLPLDFNVNRFCNCSDNKVRRQQKRW